jgi:hypothetical protein
VEETCAGPTRPIARPATPAPALASFEPSPTCEAPQTVQVWIPAQTIWRESEVVEPAVYATRRMPAFQEVEVPVFEDRCVPVSQDVYEPVYETRCDPATGVKTQVLAGHRKRVQTTTRTERVQTGTRIERRPIGQREERVLVRAATVRIVRVAETVPGRHVWVSSAPPASFAEATEPAASDRFIPRPTSPAPPITEPLPPPPPAPAPADEPTPSTELELPAPIRPR